MLKIWAATKYRYTWISRYYVLWYCAKFKKHNFNFLNLFTLRFCFFFFLIEGNVCSVAQSGTESSAMMLNVTVTVINTSTDPTVVTVLENIIFLSIWWCVIMTVCLKLDVQKSHYRNPCIAIRIASPDSLNHNEKTAVLKV